MNKKTSSGALVLAALLIGSRVTVLLGEGTAFAQQPSAGDVAQARELFNEGLALRDKGDLAGAIEKLRAADALARTPITGVELGRTELSAGKLVEAREALLAVGRLRVTPQETARSTSARAEAARLAEQVRTRIPSLVIQISGVPIESVAVTIDGAAVPTEALTAPRLVNPGSHVLVATSTSGGSTTTKVDVKEGESRTVQLTITFTGGAPVQPAGASTPAPPAGGAALPDTVSQAQPSSSPVRPVLVFGGFGLAAAGAIVGSVTGAMALSKGSSVKNACDGLVCPTSINGDLTSGRSLATVSTISFVVAGVGAVAGVVGLALHPHAEGGATAWLTPWVAPGGAGVAGALRF